MKKSISWDDYFYSRYRPIATEWSTNDLTLHRQWYASWFNYIQSKYPKDVRDKSFLEIGCGIGAMSSLLRDKGAIVKATDVSPQMLSLASKISPEIDFSYLDIQKENQHKEMYNGIIAIEVLEHVDDVDLAGKNIFRLLKKDGVFIGTTPYPYKKNMTDLTHVNVHLPQYWDAFFLSHGFKEVSLYPLSCLPYLWRIHPKLNIIIPYFIPFPFIVSTLLIIAKK